MRRDGEDRDLAVRRAVIPEDPVCAVSAILRVGFEDLLALRALEMAVLMGPQSGMAGIRFEIAQASADGFVARREAGRSFEDPELLRRLGLEEEAEAQSSGPSSACFAKLPR